MGLFSPFLFSSQLFPVPFYPHFTPLPWVNSPWWSFLPGHNYRLFFWCFSSAEMLRAGQRSHYSSALGNIVTRFSISREPNLFLWEKLAVFLLHPRCVCWCLLPPFPLAPSFPAAELHQNSFSIKNWFSVAPKIPSLWFNKETGDIQSFCCISAQCSIWLILEARSTEFISLLQRSERSINILRTQEVPDKCFLARCFHRREYWLI